MTSLKSTHRQLIKMRDIVDEALEDFVQEKMGSSQAPAMALAREVLLAGGKRYRPVLALLAFEAAGGLSLIHISEPTRPY